MYIDPLSHFIPHFLELRCYKKTWSVDEKFWYLFFKGIGPHNYVLKKKLVIQITFHTLILKESWNKIARIWLKSLVTDVSCKKS